MSISEAAPHGDGAPDDLITIRRSDLVEAMVVEYLNFFGGLSSASLSQLEAEARWIAVGGIQCAVLQYLPSRLTPLFGGASIPALIVAQDIDQCRRL